MELLTIARLNEIRAAGQCIAGPVWAAQNPGMWAEAEDLVHVENGVTYIWGDLATAGSDPAWVAMWEIWQDQEKGIGQDWQAHQNGDGWHAPEMVNDFG